MIGKKSLMAGAAAILMCGVGSGAQAAMSDATEGAAPAQQVIVPSLQLAQNDDGATSSNAELEARISALESEVQDSEIRAAQAQNAASAAPNSGWWDRTSISGRMYWDVTNIDHTSNGVRTPSQSDNGTSFDIKRFYIGVDHTFNDIFSANVTTDVTYDSSTKASQLYLKKAYLQAKIDPAFIVQIGANDTPWIPFDEGIYGYRYLENTLIELPKFGTSSDWGVHVLGSLFDGFLNYNFAALTGAGYKVAPTGGGINRFKSPDLEGRVNISYEGFGLAIGGYTGHLGQTYGTTIAGTTDTHLHTAQRLDALASYVGNGLRVGLEWFSQNNWYNVTTPTTDSGYGESFYASYNFLPQWSVFGRFDEVKPSHKLNPNMNDDYYNFGVTWSPTKIVDFSLAYKHDSVSHGIWNTQNGIHGIGGSISGSYNEIGIWSDFQW
jgi:hypothetical protein